MWPCTCRLLLNGDIDPVTVCQLAQDLVTASADPFKLWAGSMPILEVMHRITGTRDFKMGQTANIQNGNLESASTTAVQVSMLLYCHANLSGERTSPQASARCCNDCLNSSSL